MELKERVKNNLNGEDLKTLWEKIYTAYEENGKDGIKKLLEKKVDEIKERFNEIKKNVEQQIGG